MGRRADAVGSYEAVVRGYPLEPEAPAAAYLAGVGMLAQNKPLVAAPYFQLVLDRYASRADSKGLVVFATPEHQELVEAALCLLEYAYHRAGNLGQLSGAPHLLLQRMPASRSTWRAYALLIDADASAAQGRHAEAQTTLETLMREFPDHPVGASATQLLAWTYSQQGKDSLAVATEERVLSRWGASGDDALVSGAMLDIAHERFNQKRYREAAAAYQEFLQRYPKHPQRLNALYQSGLCFLRLDRAGDAVDRWEAIVRDSATAEVAERAWARAGDLYFQAERYVDARRCYEGLLANFAGSTAASLAMLRLGQCEYNAGHDAQALEKFAATIDKYPGTGAAREAQRGTELALYRLSQTPTGEKQMAQLIEKFPSSAFAADAQFKIARRAYAEKRWKDAAEGFRRVVSQFPSYSAGDQAQFLMADALAQAGDTDGAKLAYEQFISYFTESELRPTVRFRLGLIYFAAKDYGQASVAFSQALEDSAKGDVESAARYNLALCQRMSGRPEDALADLEKYRAGHPGDSRAAEVAYSIGEIHETANRPDQTITEYTQALDAKPSPRLATELWFRLGRLREGKGEKDGALHAYQNASVTGGRADAFRLSAVARCAALYESKRMFAKAVESYRDLIRNAGDHEIVAAASTRVAQLESSGHRR
jgi:TolA-binding protein